VSIRVLLTTALILLAAAADAATPPVVALGQITTRLDRRRADLDRAFRRAVETELARVDFERVRSKERFVLSAALVRLETRSEQKRSRSSCAVSATLSYARGGALHAVIDGRAQAENAPGAAHLAELAALEAAVKSVFERLPQALK